MSTVGVMHPNLYTGSMSDLPNLDTDTLVYRLPKISRTAYNTEYTIERSINGGPFRAIGTVRKVRDGDWTSEPMWSAKSTEGDTSVSAPSRKKAVDRLEYALQGPEYATRKRQAEVAAREAQAERRRAVTALAAERVQVYDRKTWADAQVAVTLDNFLIAVFYITFQEEGGSPHVRLPADQALANAEALAYGLQQQIIREALAS